MFDSGLGMCVEIGRLLAGVMMLILVCVYIPLQRIKRVLFGPLFS